ncbi:hypothetical protein FDECE_1306 [Fusarium decemcellulare]|nr:hypothetical protein FDECE_1306 [Fusarium decemcellulare]
MPDRILRISPKYGDMAEFDVKLVTANDLDEPYAALSHCWGNQEEPLKTTLGNIESWNRDIPWSWIPRTYRHGIRVASQLGLSYIWIDSLCIIQDCAADWNEQSSQMASIYENAMVTIAAASATGDAQGFLHTRTELKNGRVILESDDPRLQPTTVEFQQVLHHYFTDNTPDHTNEDPLETRAWAFQERLLSRRTLVFSKHEMLWECNTTRRSECELEDCGPRHPYHLRPVVPNDQTQLAATYNHWREVIVPGFTKGLLTNPMDKLPALSGVASRFQEMTGDQYVAGLWKNDILNQLVWEVDLFGVKRAPRQYRAPSFSWASVDGPVRFSKVQSHSWTANVIDVCCKAVGRDLYGRVAEGGYIVLEAPLVPAWLCLSPGGPGGKAISFKHERPTEPEDLYFMHDCDISVCPSPQWMQNSLDSDIICRDNQDDHSQPVEGWYRCHCVGLMSNDWGGVFGLVLGHSFRKKGAFERLGLLRLRERQFGLNDPMILKRAFQGAERAQVLIV